MNPSSRPHPPHGELELQFIRYALNHNTGKLTLIFQPENENYAEVQRTFSLVAEQKILEFLVSLTGKQIPLFSETILQDLKGCRCRAVLGPAKRPGYVNLVTILGPISTMPPTSFDPKISTSGVNGMKGGIR